MEESITVGKEEALYTVKVSDKGYDKKLPLMLSVSFPTDRQRNENLVYLSGHVINVNEYDKQGVFKYCHDYSKKDFELIWII